VFRAGGLLLADVVRFLATKFTIVCEQSVGLTRVDLPIVFLSALAPDEESGMIATALIVSSRFCFIFYK
jgi:hypothetical protein